MAARLAQYIVEIGTIKTLFVDFDPLGVATTTLFGHKRRPTSCMAKVLLDGAAIASFITPLQITKFGSKGAIDQQASELFVIGASQDLQDRVHELNQLKSDCLIHAFKPLQKQFHLIIIVSPPFPDILANAAIHRADRILAVLPVTNHLITDFKEITGAIEKARIKMDKSCRYLLTGTELMPSEEVNRLETLIEKRLDDNPEYGRLLGMSLPQSPRASITQNIFEYIVAMELVDDLFKLQRLRHWFSELFGSRPSH